MSYILENESIKLVIDEKTGSIQSLSNKKTGWELVGQKDLAAGLEMVVPYEKYENNRARSTFQLLSEMRAEENKLILIWNRITTDKAGELDISVTAEITVLSDRLLFDVSIDNKSPYIVQEIYYPCIGGIQETEEKPLKGNTLNKYGTLTEFSIGAHSSQNLGYWGTDYPTYMCNYPSNNTAAPFEIINSGKEGFFLGVHMKYNPLELNCILNEYTPGFEDAKYGTTSNAPALNGHPVGARISVVRIPFLAPLSKLRLETTVFAFYTGDWHKGIEFYREWHVDAYKKERIYPTWYKEVDSTLMINIMDQKIRYCELGHIAEEALEKGISALVLKQFTVNALTHQELGSAEELKEAVNTIHHLGLRVILDLGLNSNQSRDAEKCKISAEYRNHLGDMLVEIAGLGFDGIVYNNTLSDHACQNKWGKHDHHVGEPFIKSTGEAISNVSKELKEKDILLADYGFYTGQHKYFSMVLHSSMDCGLQNINAQPALKYIDSSLGCSVNVSGAKDYNLMNLAIAYGYIINFNPGYTKGRLKDIPQTVDYGKKLLDLRRRLRDWIWEGTFKHTEGAKVSSDNNACKYSVFINNKNNKKAIVIANCSEKEANCKIKGENISKYKAFSVDKEAVEVSENVAVSGLGLVILIED